MSIAYVSCCFEHNLASRLLFAISCSGQSSRPLSCALNILHASIPCCSHQTVLWWMCNVEGFQVLKINPLPITSRFVGLGCFIGAAQEGRLCRGSQGGMASWSTPAAAAFLHRPARPLHSGRPGDLLPSYYSRTSITSGPLSQVIRCPYGDVPVTVDVLDGQRHFKVKTVIEVQLHMHAA